MLLFFTDPTLGEFSTKGETFMGIVEQLRLSLKEGIVPETATTTITAMDNEAKKLARTIGSGVVGNTDDFREQLFTISKNVVEIGLSFTDVTDVVGDLVAETKKLTLPSTQATTKMLEFSKAVGQTSKETGKMVGQFMTLTFGQKTAINEMSKIAKLARQTGLDAKTLLNTMSTELAKVNSYNFRNGKDGLSKMAAEAQRLNTTLSDIGAFALADKLIDPENAIEVATSMSMIGGAVEGMTNPFALMNDAANNVENLQTKMIEMAKGAFKVNEATGEIETNFIAQQRLRAQIESTGGDYEKLMSLGRTAAKEQLVQNKLLSSGVDLSKVSEEQMNLVKSLTEIGEGGKLELRIPGFEQTDLVSAIEKNPTQLTDALKKYQEMAALSDRDLAEKSLNLEELQQIDTRIIRDVVLTNLGKTTRDQLLLDMVNAQKELGGKFETTAGVLGKGAEEFITARGLQQFFNAEKTKVEGNLGLTKEDVRIAAEKRASKAKLKTLKFDAASGVLNEEDAAFGSTNTKVLSLGKGEMFKFIKEDEAIFAPNAIENLGILKDVYMQTMGVAKSIPSEVKLIEPSATKTGEIAKQTVETNTNVVTTNKNEDTINLNINLNIDGKNLPNNLSDMLFKNPSTVRELENKVMDTLDKQDRLKTSKGRFIKR
jgi:hypothetical protein